MAEDLLTRIQQELEERMEHLRGAVEERDRLQADLSALVAEPAPSIYPGPPAVLGAGPGRLFDPEPPFDPVPPAVLGVDPGPPVYPGPPAALDADPAPPIYPEPAAAPKPDATVLCFPAVRDRARTHAVSNKVVRPMAAAPRPAPKRVVSAKVARLMLAPRRPALERSGIARVSERAGVSRAAPVDEPDTQADLYEHSL
jgi:hypothetical protein